MDLPKPVVVRAASLLVLAVPFWLTACSGSADPQNDATPANVMATKEGKLAGIVRNGSMVPAAPLTRTIAPTDAAAMPPGLTPEEMKGEEGAQKLLLDWTNALKSADWAEVRAQWGEHASDASLTDKALAQSYGKYHDMVFDIGHGTVEGGAGSLYYEVPVMMTGTLRDGRVEHLAGPVVARRVNDVDGSSAAQRAWHIDRSDLEPSP